MREKTGIYILVIWIAVFAFLSGCKDEESAEIKEITVGSLLIPIHSQELNMQGIIIDDFSPIIMLKDLKMLNIRDTGLTYKDVLKIKDALPECAIEYTVYFNDSAYPNDLSSLDLSELNVTDTIAVNSALKQFTNLDSVFLDSKKISSVDYLALKRGFPELAFNISIDIYGTKYLNSDTIIDIEYAESINLDEMLIYFEYFDQIQKVDFGSRMLEEDKMKAFMDAYPETDFVWNVNLLNMAIEPSVTQIDISEQKVEDFEGFKNTLRFLSNIVYIDMCDCGLSNEQMEILRDTYPDIKFVWKINIGYWELRTDIVAFSTGKKRSDNGVTYLWGGNRLQNDQAQLLKYCTDLVALDIGHQADIIDFSFLEDLNKIQYLIIAMTGIEDLSVLENMNDLLYLEVFSTDVEDLSPLLKLPNMKHLNISNTKVTETDVLMEMQQLERLWIVLTPFSKDQREELYDALPETKIVHYTTNPTTGGWRSEDCQVYIDMQELFGLKPIFSD